MKASTKGRLGALLTVSAKIKEQMDFIIEERTDYHDGKSERWQESDLGVEYQEYTEILQRIAEGLENIEEAQALFNNN